jgi:DnaJ like chaperone protein
MTVWQRITSLTNASGAAATPVAADGSSTVAFTMAVIALGAKMARADGVVSPVEVEAFHQVFKTPPDQAGHVAQVFDLAKRDVAGFESYANQVRDLLGGDQLKLRDVLECLFHIASADRALHPSEDAFLRTVAEQFGFSDSTYRHIRAQFVEDHSAPYDVLGLDPSVSDADLKVRHRKLVRENHPDLMTGRGMPVEIIDVANRKLAAINAAFATIAKERRL